MKQVDIAIVGAGIAGLAAAAACQKKGLDAHLFEAASEFKPLGTSLSLWPNAMQCLSDLGLDENIATQGHRIDQIAWRRPDGHPFFTQDLTGLYEKIGHAGYCVLRSDLHSVLLSATQSEYQNLDCKLIEAVPQSKTVKLKFESGQEVEANHVIAADGLWSTLRTQILPNQKPTYSGYGAWLGLSTEAGPSFTSAEGCEFLGRKARIGIFETGKNLRYWFVVANRKEFTKNARIADWEELVPLLAEWPNDIQNIVLNRDISAPVFVSFYDMPVSNLWGQGSITFIGDAIHPFVPNLGQGACQAIEDSNAIAEGLSRRLRGNELNQWIVKQRAHRVRELRRTALRLGKLVQSETQISRSMIRLLGMPPFQQGMRMQLEKQFKRPAYA